MNGAPAEALYLVWQERILIRFAGGCIAFRQPVAMACLFFALVLTPQTPAPLPAFA
jgi:hypothetical protein